MTHPPHQILDLISTFLAARTLPLNEVALIKRAIAIMPTVYLLDYVAGNVRSLVNAINKVGYEVEWIRSPSDMKNAEVSLN